ncbi:hypothetical protein [Hyphomicrobium sp. DY-1]|uniref:hypothetical protein n=1 Tax=Hyphomicrobium sp. DY-1 TaxID=3075650 RepID=UPI0039C0782C
MQAILSGKRVLVVKGSLLAPCALEKALGERGAKVINATNVISAFSIIEYEELVPAVGFESTTPDYKFGATPISTELILTIRASFS